MTLARQMALLILALLVLALGASLALHQWSLRDALRQQLQTRNAEAATMMALSLSPLRADEAAMRVAASAMFALGTYEHISVSAGDGRIILEQRSAARASRIPQWFLRLAVAQEPAASARLSDGLSDGLSGGANDQAVVSVQVRGDWVNDALWGMWLRTAGLLALLGAASAALAVWLLTAWQRPLQRTIEQAHGVEEGRFTLVEEPQAPELRRVARSMNSMVRRLSDMFNASAAQLADLQRRAHLDTVTGLANRGHFIARLTAALSEPSVRGRGLLIVRVLDLPGLNDRLGHDKVDALLVTLADVMATYPQRVPDTITGRLNGTDLALALPVAGITRETGESLMMALRAAAAAALGVPALSANTLAIVIGGVDVLRGQGASGALAAADAALAQAEEGGAYTLVVEAALAEAPSAAGARVWRDLIARALNERRVRLLELAVSDAHGRLLHLRCPLQLQLDPQGPYLPARRWLGIASRSRLMPQLDLCAVDLALRAIALDGRARCVHLAAVSLATAGFVDELGALLGNAAAAAPQLRVEVDERGLTTAAAVLPTLFTALRHHGVRLGIEHAGSALYGDLLMRGVALAHVTLGAHLVRGVASDAAVHELARGLVSFVHGLGATIIAEGAMPGADLAALWALGFDGVSVSVSAPS